MIECKYCGKTFKPISITQTYCSTDCRTAVNLERAKKNWAKQQAEKDPITKNCAYCGAEFIYTIHNKRYCSKKCAYSVKYEYTKNKRKEEKEKPKDIKSMAELQREAKERNMSYGIYRAWLEGRLNVNKKQG